jgi:glucose/arabinose dehydrogenase
MRKTWIAGSLLGLLAAAPQVRAQQIALSPFVTGLSNVVHVQHGGDGSGRLYLVQQNGVIRVHDGVALRPTPFLNIDPIVQCCGEEGLLSVAFHPSYAANGFFYVYYTNNQGNNVVARYQRSATDPFQANPASGLILLTISHPTFSNHNGGSMNFGPDGYLYVDTGDGGGGGDPNENAQNLGSLLGKQLRMDVDHPAPGSNYGIPPTNPFVGVGGAQPLVWAYGLRNPFRFSFDRQTGDMFIGDVGQNEWEEIDFQPANSTGGLNYGWDDMEGAHCYEPPSGCLTAGRVLPIIEIQHGAGDCAIIGGYRYRGTQMPAQVGRYFHSDNCSGRIRAAVEGPPGVWTEVFSFASTHNITTFGEDQNGELYVSGTDASTVYRLVSVPPTTISVADRTVSEAAGTATFTVSLSAAIGAAVTVQYSTAPGTATAGTDYTAVSGTITFPPATATATVSVPIANDLLDENDETFVVNLASPSANASIADGQAQGTIADDDPLPSLGVSECAVVEGNAGSTPCTFAFTLAPVSGRPVSVGYFTMSGTAVSGSDFTAASGAITLPPGSTTASVPVGVLGDAVVEPDEAFTLELNNVANAALDSSARTGAILDDDAPSLSNLELTHASVVKADLALGAADFYRFSQSPHASYEAVLDEVSGDAVPGLLLEELDADNTTVVQTAVVEGTGTSASLRFINPFAAAIQNRHLRLRNPACGAGCGPDDTYRLRFYETTLSGTRFNNASGQSSIVILQNPTSRTVAGHVAFWSPGGSLLSLRTFTLAARASVVILTNGIASLGGQAGSLTVAHDAPYGSLVGKVVALEPSTGFSFDTPLLPRPR